MVDRKVMSQCISVDYCNGWNDAVKAIEEEQNAPFTIDDLIETNEPVWIKRGEDLDLCDDGWAMVERYMSTRIKILPASRGIKVWWYGSEVEDYPKYENYGKTWFAYRKRPND